MAETSRLAARALRLLLALAVVCVLGGVAFQRSTAGGPLRVAGLWTIALTPFVILLIVSAEARRTRWFAFGTIALVLIGFLLAR